MSSSVIMTGAASSAAAAPGAVESGAVVESGAPLGDSGAVLVAAEESGTEVSGAAEPHSALPEGCPR